MSAPRTSLLRSAAAWTLLAPLGLLALALLVAAPPATVAHRGATGQATAVDRPAPATSDVPAPASVAAATPLEAQLPRSACPSLPGLVALSGGAELAIGCAVLDAALPAPHAAPLFTPAAYPNAPRSPPPSV